MQRSGNTRIGKSLRVAAAVAAVLALSGRPAAAEIAPQPQSAPRTAPDLARPAPAPQSNATNVWQTVQSQSDTIQVYQPSPESFQDDVIKASAAISVSSGGGDPLWGTAWLTAPTSHGAEGEVVLKDLEVEVRLPGASADMDTDYARALRIKMSKLNLTFTLAQINQGLIASRAQESTAAQVATAPPEIVHVLLADHPGDD